MDAGRFDYSRIPEMMQAARRWLLWREELDSSGRPTKIPYGVHGLKASSTNPKTWSDFPTALAKYQRSGPGGLGFTAGDGWYGLDFDNVLDEKGRIRVDFPACPDVVDWIAGFAAYSYIELSPSRCGLRVIGRGRLPEWAKNRVGNKENGGIEAYDHARFFTITGNVFEDCTNLTEATDESLLEGFLEAAGMRRPEKPPRRRVDPTSPPPLDIDDEQLLELARNAKNGSDFDRLYGGDTSSYDHDDSRAEAALCTYLAFWTQGDPDRIDRLVRSSGLYRPKWDERRGDTTYGAMTIDAALAICTEYYSPRDRAAPPHSSRQQEPAGFDDDDEDHHDRADDDLDDGDRDDADGAGELRQTDLQFAKLIVRQHGNDLRYAPGIGWLYFDGRRFKPDSGGAVMRKAKNTAVSMYSRAAAAEEVWERKFWAGWAPKCESAAKLAAGITLAQSELPIEIDPGELDTDPWLLNCQNGTVDLRTGQLREHRRDDLLTRIAPAVYNPDATAPTWERHLERCLPDPNVRGFLQRAAGLSAIGEVRDHLLIILIGTGDNGKSKTVGALMDTLGPDYAHAGPLSLLMQTRRSGHQEDLANLRGRRLVAISEFPENAKLAVEAVKWITGGDRIRASRKGEHEIEFNPTHTIWLGTNHLPRVEDDGHAIWRRIKLIPFEVTIPEAEQDPEIDRKLRAERDGILSWIVAGAVSYHQNGLQPPDAVKLATREYRESENTFSEFLAECTIDDPEAAAKAGDILATYTKWAPDNGAPTLNRNTLAEKLKNAGYHRSDNRKRGSLWQGLRLHQTGTLDDEQARK